jgi:site-specific DNA-methyltransferase (adenine-specific)
MITILKGDCLEVMKDLSDASVDCFICDLPYGCLHPERNNPQDVKKYNGSKGAIGCAWDVKIDLAAFWMQVKRLARNDHVPVLMFCTTKFGIDLINSNPSWFRYDLVWDKGHGVSFLTVNKMPMRSHEMIYVFSKKGAFYKRVDIKGDFKECKQYGKAKSDSTYGVVNRNKPVTRPVGTITSTADKRCPLSIIPVRSKKGGHPTQKPIELYLWLLERYCPDGGTVLDPTAGSFNACFAAEELGLDSIGIEKDEVFFKKAEDIIAHV